jgi:tripartite-type tricarboxylate transporter receptor subunit TctC
MTFRWVRHFALMLVTFYMMTGTAWAQTYPNKPLRLIVGFPPGGAVDILARTISQPLSVRLGQPVVVENRPGAGGNIAAAHVAQSDPDGYTILISAVSSLAISASLYHHLNYSLANDLAPVAAVASIPNVLVVNAKVKANSVTELIALAKAEPGKLNFGSAGTGTTVHLAGELFRSMAGVNIVHVPYKGASQAMSDLLGNQVNMMFDFLSAAGPQIKAGQLRALGVTSSTRSEAFPDVPTIAEAGLPGYEVLGYLGIFARSGTPPAVIDRLNREMAAVVSAPDVKRQLALQSATPISLSPAEFSKDLKMDVAKWAKIISTAGIQIE